LADVSTTKLVRAAGGVVWRQGPESLEIALVHRPRYDDWSLPKGKLNRGEHPLAAAVREVYEETAVRATPRSRLPTIRYLTGQPGVEKLVDFWAMRAESWSPREPDHEIADVRWIAGTDALSLLSYVHDRGVVKAFLEQPPPSGVVAIVRHGNAGERGSWPGDDNERPLDTDGVAQSEQLASLLGLLAPRRIVSAMPKRCVQTMQPLAAYTDLVVETDPAFNEDAAADDAADAVRDLAGATDTVVICSQGDLIPPVLCRLTGRVLADFATRKGTGWIVPLADAAGYPVDFLDPANWAGRGREASSEPAGS
jgi:8-oxo-(d)GTP phosphatase